MDGWGGARAIETRYADVRFRSRLEARWAVFMDALGIQWEYEAQGFNLDGAYYLPDFWLLHNECWVEVKPENTGVPPEIQIAGFLKAKLLAEHTGKLVYVLNGPVDPMSLYERGGGIVYFPEVLPNGSSWRGGALWASCLECGTVALTLGPGSSKRPFESLTALWCGHEALGTDDNLAAAWVTARGYRFWDPA